MILPAHHRSTIISHARQRAPEEACGILAGAGARIRRVYRLPNIAESPLTRFLADPEAQLRSLRDLERRGLEMLAVYHSHPRSPAYPSPSDVEMAYYPDARQVIVSLAEPRPRLRCFTIRDGEISEETLLTGRAPSAANLG